MYRTDAPNNAITPPTPSALGAEEFFRDGTAGTGDGTLLGADYLNAIQESLIAIIDDQSITHSKTDHTKLLAGIRSLVRELSDANAADDLRGFIAGLRTVITGFSTFEITPGMCRDRLDASNMELSGSNFALDTSIAWNTGTGSVASSFFFSSPNFSGRVFALGKPAPSTEINFGIDLSPTGLNLLADAASFGFTTVRQIGWVHHLSVGLIEYIQDAADPDFWRLKEPRQMGLFADQSVTPIVYYSTAIAPTDDAQFYGSVIIHPPAASPAEDTFVVVGGKTAANPPSDSAASTGVPSQEFHTIKTTLHPGLRSFTNVMIEADLSAKNLTTDLGTLEFVPSANMNVVSSINGYFQVIHEGFRWNRSNPK